jgi:hypothetical protein
MSNEITPQHPETISDLQLEGISRGLFDNNVCYALMEASVNVLC